MSSSLVPKKAYFSKVREAREALKQEALKLHEMHMKIIEQAAAAEDFKVAIEAIQWLREHMPSEEGVTVIERSVDIAKSSSEGESKGPKIQIGIALGGLPTAKQLEDKTEVVEALDFEPVPDEETN